jgi:cell division protein FtsN
MTENNFFQMFFNLLPALVVGVIAFYFFQMHIKNEENRRRFILRQENQKTALPLRLQAYERMALFLERISLGKLLLRVKPAGRNIEDYENLLAQTIDMEFEHNLAQQIYLSGECWNVIKTAKNATIGMIRKAGKREDVENAEKLREILLTNLMDQASPTDAALEYIKKDLRKII